MTLVVMQCRTGRASGRTTVFYSATPVRQLHLEQQIPLEPGTIRFLIVIGLALFIAQAGAQKHIAFPLIGDPQPYPVVQPNLISDIMVAKTMYNTLVRFSFDDGVTPVPDLAESWTANEDASEWVFNLRQDVQWHDGEPFTAHDVVFTIQAIVNPEVGSRWSSGFASLESVEALDEYTVRFAFNEPFAPMLSVLAYNISLVPQHVLEGQDLSNPEAFRRNPVGTGPFKFMEQVSGSHLTVEANLDYHEGRPDIDRVTFRVTPDVNSQIAQLLTGELDVTWTVEPVHYNRVSNAANLTLSTAQIPRWDWLPLNLANPLFQDARVRRALAYALDRESMVDRILAGQGEVAHGPIPNVIDWVPTEGVEQITFDPEYALELLAEAGWTRDQNGALRNAAGEPFAFTLLADRGNPTRDQTYLYVQQAWQALGMQVDIETTEWNTVLARYRRGEYDARLGWWVIKPDPDLYDYFHTNGDLNQINYSNPQLDELLERGRATTDQAERAEIYNEVQRLLVEEQPGIFLYYPIEVRAVNNRLQGLPEIGYRDALIYLHRATVND
jgi:peptide/nickel transport system substrate-binding protein